MKYFTDVCKLPGRYGNYKRPRVSEVMNHFGIDESTVVSYAKDLFGDNDIGFHDARFDTAAVLSFFSFVENI